MPGSRGWNSDQVACKVRRAKVRDDESNVSPTIITLECDDIGGIIRGNGLVAAVRLQARAGLAQCSHVSEHFSHAGVGVQEAPPDARAGGVAKFFVLKKLLPLEDHRDSWTQIGQRPADFSHADGARAEVVG